MRPTRFPNLPLCPCRRHRRLLPRLHRTDEEARGQLPTAQLRAQCRAQGEGEETTGEGEGKGHQHRPAYAKYGLTCGQNAEYWSQRTKKRDKGISLVKLMPF